MNSGLKSKIDRESKYWEGKGRKLIVIPHQVLRTQVMNNPLLYHLFITDIGYYPHAHGHNTHRSKGSAQVILIWCSDGQGWYKTPAGQFTVHPGQFFILKPYEEHSYGANDEDPWTISWIRFGGADSWTLCAQKEIEQYFRPSPVIANNNIIQLFDDIYTTLEKGYSIDHLAYVNMTLFHLLACFIYPKKTSEIQKQPIDFVDRVIGYMKENTGKHITLESFAKAFNYSSSRFSGLFRNKTGYSPIDYFIQLKIQKACQLLDLTDTKINVVASQLGYEDPLHFSKVFKKNMGMSPEKYRSIHKG